jgi:hypothetical protein
MNWILITILDVVNKLLAILVVISSTAEGYLGDFRTYVGPTYGVPHSLIGAVVGFILGLALAGVISGLIAAIITIARELTALRELMSVRVFTAPPPS